MTLPPLALFMHYVMCDLHRSLPRLSVALGDGQHCTLSLRAPLAASTVPGLSKLFYKCEQK